MAGRNWWLKNNYDVFYTVDMFRLLNSVETTGMMKTEGFHHSDIAVAFRIRIITIIPIMIIGMSCVTAGKLR